MSTHGYAQEMRSVTAHPGFVELSCHNDMTEPWAVGLRLHGTHRITWLFSLTRSGVVKKALQAIDLLGDPENRTRRQRKVSA